MGTLHKTIIVVLGKKLGRKKYPNGDISVVSEDMLIRVRAATMLMRQGGFDGVCFSGGPTAGVDLVTGADVMASYYASCGFDAEHKFYEHHSRNTAENAACVYKILSLVGFADADIHLVTSDYHMPRALREFQKYFPVVLPRVAEDVTGDKNTNRIEAFFDKVKESIRRQIPDCVVNTARRLVYTPRSF